MSLQDKEVEVMVCIPPKTKKERILNNVIQGDRAFLSEDVIKTVIKLRAGAYLCDNADNVNNLIDKLFGKSMDTKGYRERKK